ncbi:MAG TPA: four helix bundle protein [Chitinophagales bacterium]|nr:four helix bundle protein [Chitinophagales bacterium]HMU68598.1 four helix bundle protein [Chitinophagales bacterium]HMX03500.1 four helix bundle protein [Chitinophagales bacterium]HMZ89886.1 four helix bundle protein [Chitinophagales bacterium]HNE45992.1 four helix bundle protein [Chitinophagales bacterium]
MFLDLPHKRMDVYIHARKLLLECRKVTDRFPHEEKFVLALQIRRAALSVFLNIAEGSSRFSKAERRRFYEISRSSIVELDAAFDIAETYGYTQAGLLSEIGELIVRLFQMLSKLINNSQ